MSTVPNFPEIAGTHFLSISDRQTTQILKSDPKKGVSVVAKMLVPQVQVDEGFWHGCTNRSNLEMEPKHLTKSDV